MKLLKLSFGTQHVASSALDSDEADEGELPDLRPSA